MFECGIRLKLCYLSTLKDLGQFSLCKQFWNNAAAGIAGKRYVKTEPLAVLIEILLCDCTSKGHGNATAQEQKASLVLVSDFHALSPFQTLCSSSFLFLIRVCFLVFHCCSLNARFIVLAQLKFVPKPEFCDCAHCPPTFTPGQRCSEPAGSSDRGTEIHIWLSDTFEFCFCRQYEHKPLELWVQCSRIYLHVQQSQHRLSH